MRPSELIDVEEVYAAYCFDDACDLWGRYIENQVQEAGKNIKNQTQREMVQTMTLQTLLRGYDKEEERSQQTTGQFRDPMESFRKQQEEV